MSEKEFLSVDELKIGMIIASDVFKNGSLLIKKNSVVTDDLINVLNRAYFLDKIEVTVPEEVLRRSSKEEELKRVEEKFKEVSTELENMFEKMKRTKDYRINNDLRDFADKIQKEIKSTEIVVSNILFKGSGEDCIYRHGVNVAALSALLGRWLNFDAPKINLLIYTALLHDFGMIKLDAKLQEKPDIILENRYKEIREHTKIGYKVVDAIPYLDKSVSYGVLMHHEREDGSGYLGVKGEKIHPFAKIIAIADELDVMNSDIKGVEKKGPFETLEEIKKNSLNKFDYSYAKTFLQHVANYYMGEDVILSDDRQGKILQINTENISKPLILVDGEFVDLNKEKDIFIKELIVR